MTNQKNRSLGDQLSSRISSWIFVLVISITAVVCAVSFLQSRQMFFKQVETWESVIPRQALTSLIDSDDLAIKREVDVLKSTGLFTAVQITDNQKRVIDSFGEDESSGSNLVPIKDDAGVTWGYYQLRSDFYHFADPFVISAIVFFFLIVVLYFFIRWRIRLSLDAEFQRFNHFLNEIELLTSKIHDIYRGDDVIPFNENETYTSEQVTINRAVSNLLSEIRNANEALKVAISSAEQKRFQDELTATALQVAHDIGSPLATLEAIVQSASLSLSEESRVAIQNTAAKMRDITNTLLKRVKHDLLSVDEGMLARHSLQALIGQVITEKRIQYRDCLGVNINFTYDKTAYHAFAVLRAADLNRMLSNLINNAVEAMNDGIGDVVVSLSQNDHSAVITVKDNGKGIPADVIGRLGCLGVTYGKQNGHGLGLFHAKATLENWGGRLEIQSELGCGTNIIMHIPKARPPEWFVPEIKVYHGQVVIIIDDDEAIHEIWRRRFHEYSGEHAVNLLHFTTPQSLIDWYEVNEELRSLAIYLCDYEFINAEINGLDLISKLGINYRSILVTCRYDRDDIISRCEIGNIRLLPKDLAGIVSIFVVDKCDH